MDERDLTEPDLIARSRQTRENARIAVEEAYESIARAHALLQSLADERRLKAAAQSFASK